MANTTGHKCPQSGIYESDCRDKVQIALSKDDTFPPCRNCSRAVNWRLLRATQN